MTKPKTLWLAPYHRAKNQLSMSFGVDDLAFFTTYWYQDVDLLALERQFGVDFMEKLYFHMVAFEANKLTSLQPEAIDPGPYQKFHTPAFETLWSTIQYQVWAQWRYENQLPEYRGPRFSPPPAEVQAPAAVSLPEDNDQALLFCGGGKDSLVAMDLLASADIPYSTLAYSSSIYGRAEVQHRLLDGLVDTVTPQSRHRMWVYEDFIDSPVVALAAKEQGITTLTAAETPSSLFAALPLVLQHRYRHIGLGHERSADEPNLIWDQTGEAVNHQWGKSYAAEKLLNEYINVHFVTNTHYFSPLKPIYDVVIFHLLGQSLAGVPRTHSCNLEKPWCKKCAKCAYVWLNYQAYLPTDLVDAMFGVNLFDLPENEIWFRQMLGLAEHTPFECIGQVEEARLAFELCRRKGLTGKAMDIYTREVRDFDPRAAVERLATVDAAYPAFPEPWAERLFARLNHAAASTRETLLRGL